MEEECRDAVYQICPYCGKEDYAYYCDLSDEGETECEHCGKTFKYRKEWTMEIITNPIT